MIGRPVTLQSISVWIVGRPVSDRMGGPASVHRRSVLPMDAPTSKLCARFGRRGHKTLGQLLTTTPAPLTVPGGSVAVVQS